MAARTRDIFTTIHTEGAVLPPDLLQRIADGDGNLDGLRPEDYHRSGEKLNEVINRAWNVLLGAWANFQGARANLKDDLGTTITRERWLLPLFRELDYGRLSTTHTFEIDGKGYPISHARESVPIHLVSYQLDLDRRTPGVAGAAATSPHSLVQVYLNRSEDALWGFVSNGLRLRILRDNVSLTRQAYVEFDLEAMMNGEVYADFVMLWLLCHQSRVEGDRLAEFWLEKWMQTARQEGTRALEQLRDRVEEAITALGEGFLAHPHNATLRDKLRTGALSKDDYYRQLLRMVYRLLFLFVAEDRGLLLDPGADETARARYLDYYSTRRLRRLAERFRGTRHHDLYHGLRLVMQLLGAERNGEGRALGLPVLGSFLFSDAAVADLIACDISNSDLLAAIRALAYTEDRAVRALRPVDYKNLGPEELGSVYESLLELHPQINVDATAFALATASGNERKTTGSYYTPSSLIQALLDSALDPVLDEARRADDPAAAILALKVCDPACGSGHFLIAAAHRLAKALAAAITYEEEPAPDAIRTALRDVIGHCIYGVDINPMAVELCKVGLWMEALEPGKPLSFLDHRIQCGNSLLGTTPRLMADGIPDDAFQPIEGDDKKVVSALRKRNKQERKQREVGSFQHGLFDAVPPANYGVLAAEVKALDALSDATMAGVRAKEARYRALADDPDYIAARLLADAWCAAFVWEKTSAALLPMTDLLYRRLEDDPHAESLRPVREQVVALREHYRFFHWHVAFPDVFHVPEQVDTESVTGWDGGFDVVLGNPPWEGIKADPIEFFSVTAPDIANAPNMAQRNKLIKAMAKTSPELLEQWQQEIRRNEALSLFINKGGFYPLTSYGRLNTYSLFAELAGSLIGSVGQWGMILPIGIATDAFNQYYFGDLIDQGLLVSLFGFENEDKVFPGVHNEFKFGLVTVSGSSRVSEIDLAFFLRATADLSSPGRRYHLTARDFRLINPNTLTCPVFKFKRDAEITSQIYHDIPVLLNERANLNPWQVRCQLMYMANTVSEIAITTSDIEGRLGRRLDQHSRSHIDLVPLYEAKMFHQFDHRFGTYLNQTQAQANKGKLPELTPEEHTDPNYLPLPRYWLRQNEVEVSVADFVQRQWFVSWRDVTGAVVFRTTIVAILPFVGTNDTAPLAHFPERTASEVCCFVANGNSFPLDFVTRQKLGGAHLRFFSFYQLPFLPPSTYTPALLDFITPRVLELTYTAWDLQPFAQDVGWDGPPFVWDEDRRFLMRCELDALYFHLYGIARDDVDYIMETFPIVKRKDIAATTTDDFEGEYITKRIILEMFDQMAALGVHDDPDAIARYQTWLTPPPADPGVAHPPRA
jgi:hypothetical protein